MADDLIDRNESDELDPEIRAETEAAAPAAPQIEVTSRVFKVGTTVIREDASLSGLANEQARDILKMMYPEVANGTIRETIADGVKTVEFLPQPGRKG